jgi:hypothetical protein
MHSLFEKTVIHFQTWYFERYVRQFDPHPTFLPFTGESFWIVPLLSAAVAAAVTGKITDPADRVLSLLIGVSLGLGVLSSYEFHTSWPVVMLTGVVTLLGAAVFYLVGVLRARSGVSTKNSI